MIREAKKEAALKALHVVILKARSMAYEDSPHLRIAELLDGAEYLVALLFDSEDMTETYRNYIEEISEEFGCKNALELFEQSAPPRFRIQKIAHQAIELVSPGGFATVV